MIPARRPQFVSPLIELLVVIAKPLQNVKRFARRSRQSAFTLIELLVVIAIVGTLSAMLLVAVQRARQHAWKAQCISNLRQIGQGLSIYYENNRRFPEAANRPSLGISPLPPITEAMADYLPSATFRCGADQMGLFEKEGSSYEWNTLLNGISRERAAEIIGEVVPGGDAGAATFWDYEPFHGKPGSRGARHMLFLDGHVEGI